MSTSLGRYHAVVLFAAVLLGSALAAAGLGWGGWRAYLEFSGQIDRFQAYRDLQRNAGRADSLIASYESLSQELRSLREGLPAENRSSYVVNVLVEEARVAGLAISGITALDEIPFPGYVELPFEVGLAGRFPDFLRYLHSLETRGMAVQARRLEAEAEEMNRAKIKVRLELSVFAPQGPKVAAGAAP